VALAEQGVKPSILSTRSPIELEEEEDERRASSRAEGHGRTREEGHGKPPVVEVVKWIVICGCARQRELPRCEGGIPDRGSVKLETSKNHVIAGNRPPPSLPLPATTLYEGPFSLETTRSLERRDPAQDSPRRWGAGVVGSLDTAGKWALGPQVGYHFSRLDFSLGITFPDQRAIGAVTVRW
jgi:hypothetical protein